MYLQDASALKYSFTKLMRETVPLLRLKVKHATSDELKTFLTDIRVKGQEIGQVAMRQMQRSQEEGEDEGGDVDGGVEDGYVHTDAARHHTFLRAHAHVHVCACEEEGWRGCDNRPCLSLFLNMRHLCIVCRYFHPLYRCLHIYEVMGIRSECEAYYKEERKKQAQLVLSTSLIIMLFLFFFPPPLFFFGKKTRYIILGYATPRVPSDNLQWCELSVLTGEKYADSPFFHRSFCRNDTYHTRRVCSYKAMCSAYLSISVCLLFLHLASLSLPLALARSFCTLAHCQPPFNNPPSATPPCFLEHPLSKQGTSDTDDSSTSFSIQLEQAASLC